MKNIVSLLNEFKKIGLTSFDGVTRCVYDENWLAAQKSICRLLVTTVFTLLLTILEMSMQQQKKPRPKSIHIIRITHGHCN